MNKNISHRDTEITEIRERFSVSYEYPVLFTREVFNKKNTCLASLLREAGDSGPHPLMTFVDSGVSDTHPNIIEDITAYVQTIPELASLRSAPVVIPGGEQTKGDWAEVQDIMDSLIEHHMCRHSIVLAVGGGGVLDVAGFAASLVHRGLRVIRIPTTVLSQNDSGVGVKTGVNRYRQKNALGTFAPPMGVINDVTFLTTLENKDWLGGISEAFKVAIIKDSAFFTLLLEKAELLHDRDLDAMETLIRKCAELHLEHIRTGGDPFEFGTARPLDFGHWSAHRIEVLSDYETGHGQAVAIGVALDSYYAMKTGLIREEEFDRIINGLLRCGLPVWTPLLEETSPDDEPAVFKGLQDFREHLGGELTLVLPKGIGAQCEVHEVDKAILAEGIRCLKEKMHA